jgi:hypothetical protein
LILLRAEILFDLRASPDPYPRFHAKRHCGLLAWTIPSQGASPVKNPFRASDFAPRILSLLIACIGLSGYGVYAAAQAVPQLLPYTVTAAADGGTLGTSTAKYTAGNYCGTNTTTI